MCFLKKILSYVPPYVLWIVRRCYNRAMFSYLRFEAFTKNRPKLNEVFSGRDLIQDGIPNDGNSDS